VSEVRVVVQIRDSAREICLGNRRELLEAVNFRSDIVHWPADTARRTERLVALLDANGPHISGPGVHVLEELAVDRS
jgi:hypothetical protein